MNKKLHMSIDIYSHKEVIHIGDVTRVALIQGISSYDCYELFRPSHLVVRDYSKGPPSITKKGADAVKYMSF